MEYLKIRKYRDNNGFTMIEVLVAIILIIIGILSVISLAIMVIKGNFQSKKTTVATTIAQEKIEDLIRQGHDAISTSTGSTSTAQSVYYWCIYVQDDTPVDDTKMVTVDVWWGTSSASGSNTVHKNVELETIIAQ